MISGKCHVGLMTKAQKGHSVLKRGWGGGGEDIVIQDSNVFFFS